MKKDRVILGVGLILLSVLLHSVHYVLFHDMHHLMVFLVADIAFIPLEVFFVSMVLDRLIEKREHAKTVNKMNMIVGLFYQEVGNSLLTEFVRADRGLDLGDISADYTWGPDEYKELKTAIEAHPHTIDIEALNIMKVDMLLSKFQPNVLGLITNQALQEHERFTDLLMSITHLFEEIKQRTSQRLTKHDREHLTGDVERVYGRLSLLWVDYLQYLQKEYPFLFLTAVTNNPYDVRERAEIEQEVLLSRC